MFAQDVSYDEHDKTVFDVFLPDSSTPTPLVIYIHGGGFTGGDKASIYSQAPDEVYGVLNAGRAFASFNYRLLNTVDTDVLFHHPFHGNAVRLRAIEVGLEEVSYLPALKIADESGEEILSFFARILAE